MRAVRRIEDSPPLCATMLRLGAAGGLVGCCGENVRNYLREIAEAERIAIVGPDFKSRVGRSS